MGADVPCACCSTLRALLHCAQHGARLCLPCDVRVHAAAQDHRRAPLGDGCHAAPAAARCAHHQALLCAPCARAAGCDADRHARRAARAYTGIPELARILYCECDTAAPPPLSPAPEEWVPDLVNVELLPDLPSSSSSSWRDGNITRPDTSDELLPGSLIETGGAFDAQMIGSSLPALPTGDGDGDGDELFMQQDWPNLDDAAGLDDDDFNFIVHDSNLTNSFNLMGRREGPNFEPQASPSLGYDHPLIASCSEPIIASTDAVLESMAGNNIAAYHQHQHQFSSVATANNSTNVGSTFYGTGMLMLPRDELPTRHLSFDFEVKPPVPAVVSSPSTGGYHQYQAEAAALLVASSAPEKPPSGQDMEARTKQLEKRQEAKQRYKDKKKNRKFGKQIMYVSRKVRADTRSRVKGRFAKACSGSGHSGDDQSTQHCDENEQPTDSCL